MEHYLGVAEAEGVTQPELDAVRGIVMAVQAGRVRAQLRRVSQRRRREEP